MLQPWEEIWAEIQIHSGSNVHIVSIHACTHTHSHNETGLNKLNEPCTFLHTTTFCLKHEVLNHTYALILLTGALNAHTHILQTGSGSMAWLCCPHTGVYITLLRISGIIRMSFTRYVCLHLFDLVEHNKHGCVMNMILSCCSCVV